MPLTDPCPQCGKRRYTFTEARKHAKRMRRLRSAENVGNRRLTAYRCAGTSWWHIGHLAFHGGNRRQR